MMNFKPLIIVVAIATILFLGSSFAQASTVEITPIITEGENGWYTRTEFQYHFIADGGPEFNGTYNPNFAGHRTIKFFKDTHWLWVQLDVNGSEFIPLNVCDLCLAPGVPNEEDLSEVFSMSYAFEPWARIEITNPDPINETTADNITLSGTYAIAPGSDADITVNGVFATKQANNRWEVTVPLVEGSNVITADILSIAGNTDSASILVVRTSTSTQSNNSQNNSSSNSDGGGNSSGEESQPTPPVQPKPGKVLGISTVDRNASDFIHNQMVPVIVDRISGEVFGRKITPAESTYWKGRARSDKATESKLRGAMAWHKAHGSTGVKAQSSAKQSVGSLVSRINAIFRSVYDRNPSPSENRYWLSRIADKVTEVALRGAMLFHKQQGITH